MPFSTVGLGSWVGTGCFLLKDDERFIVAANAFRSSAANADKWANSLFNWELDLLF